MHPALEKIRQAVSGTAFQTDLYLVGGAVRDELLGVSGHADFDFVTTGNSQLLANLLSSLSSIRPVVYPRFGTAMLRIEGAAIELVSARKESYGENSRKPDVASGTLREDLYRRDFTVNTLLKSLDSGEILDLTGNGLTDLSLGILRTPRDPAETFSDDPLRMMRAIRFAAKLGFRLEDGLLLAIRNSKHRLAIVSFERLRDELVKMLEGPSGPEALANLMDLGLLSEFAPEFVPMVGCEQGKYHHLDVWDHTLLVLKNVGPQDLILSLAALFHDIGKPNTRMVDVNGNTRFIGHEIQGAETTKTVLRRLKFPQNQIEIVATLVKNHMRLGTALTFSASAARRLLRDMDGETDRLMALVEADIRGLKPGVKSMDLEAVRSRVSEVREAVPVEQLQSPLTGEQIMSVMNARPGPQIGLIKAMLTEKVIEGDLQPGDEEGARRIILRLLNNERD